MLFLRYLKFRHFIDQFYDLFSSKPILQKLVKAIFSEKASGNNSTSVISEFLFEFKLLTLNTFTLISFIKNGGVGSVEAEVSEHNNIMF